MDERRTKRRHCSNPGSPEGNDSQIAGVGFEIAEARVQPNAILRRRRTGRTHHR